MVAKAHDAGDVVDDLRGGPVAGGVVGGGSDGLGVGENVGEGVEVQGAALGFFEVDGHGAAFDF